MMTQKKKTTSRKKSVRTPKKDGDRRGTNQKSLANLKPQWKKGDPSPNPTGRPKLIGEAYKEWLATVRKDGKTNAQAVANAIGNAALEGETGAAREIRAATEDAGHVEAVDSAGGTVIFRIVRDEPKRIPDPSENSAS
jgi:hypothetical protein